MTKPAGLSVSPLSASSNESSYAPRYPPSGSIGGTVNDAPYTGGPYGGARPLQKSPPSSQHPSSSTDMSRPSQGSSVPGRSTSSASSVASNGRVGYPSRDSARNSSRGALSPHSEEALHRHYSALRVYLAASLHDDKGHMRPNRARDKLLRLSVTQFMELSTDVYDELIRREDERLQRVPDVPRSLPPKQNFHPKRNQARQKLSTLPIERFRQLATDVFFELERRIPRFAAGDMDRPKSAASSRAPSRGGMRPPPGAIRPPPPGMGGYGPMSPGGPNGMGPPRPFPKTLQSNTIVPNKSTMVEDDDDDDNEFALDNVVTGLARRDTNVDGESLEKIRSQEAEIEDLKEKLLEKEQELQNARSSGQTEINNLREELEQKHMDAQKLNDALRHELDQLHKDKSQDERDIRAQHDRSLDDLRAQLDNAHKQLDDLHGQLETHQSESRELRLQLQQGGAHHQPSDNEYQRRIEHLEQELANQEKITKEVRDEATMLLQEMRDLSQQNDQAIEQEEKLAAQVSKLEQENENWRQRYAKVKAQNKSLRASHIGLSLQTTFDAGSLLRKDALTSQGGLVKDVDITRFQIAIEELLKVARQSNTNAMIDTVKNVAVSVQSITSVVGTDGYPTPSSPQSPEESAKQPTSVAKLKARVTGTANSLITQTKLHASASGLSPVALLDAQASNLTAAVVELVKAVGIRPSPKTELEDAEVDADVDRDFDDPDFDEPSLNVPAFNERSIDVPTFNERSIDVPTFNERSIDVPTFNERSIDGPAFSERSIDGPAFREHSIDDSVFNEPVPVVNGEVEYRHSMEDYYDEDEYPEHEDHLSPTSEPRDSYDDRSPSPVTVTVTPADARPPPLGTIGRNNTFRKMNDWFGWGSKSNTPEPPSTPISNGDTGYDPYR